MSPERTNLETRISDALRQEAETAIASTDTRRELDRFLRRTRQRRTFSRAVVVVAVACLIVVTATAIGLIVAHFSGDHHTTPAHHPKSTHQVLVPAVPTHTFGPAKPLPADVHVTTVRGPEYLGVVAFGDVWATGGTGQIGVLYRLSSDGTRVLSHTASDGPDAYQLGPVQVGDAIAVVGGSEYMIYNEQGHLIGFVNGFAHAVITGDSTGGWAKTKANQVARLDSTGLHVVRRLNLAVSSIDGLAASPGLLWVIDATNNQLVRVSTSTGAVTGRLTLPAVPMQVTYIDRAVYVATADNTLRRIDPATMTVTAALLSSAGQSWPLVAHAPSGQLWAQGDAGTIAQLDPLTLRVERNIRVYPTANDPAIGAVVTAHHVFIGDPHNEIHTFSSH